jgi:peroxiredoxin
VQVELQWLAEKKDEARETFETLRKLSGSIQLDAPVFDRLEPIARDFGFCEDWRVVNASASDVGERPNLDDLGPFCWSPSPAPSWNLIDAAGKPHALADYRGRPVVAIFFLGSGCLHCAEQLQKFAPMAEKFRAAGIELVAISTDDQAGLQTSIDNYHSEFPFPLLSDAELTAFRAYRAYDDFERKTLHGTFLIDASGQLRWQDIAAEPFMDPQFVLTEAQRLLAIPDSAP